MKGPISKCGPILRHWELRHQHMNLGGHSATLNSLLPTLYWWLGVGKGEEMACVRGTRTQLLRR